jgi:RNA polymerase sigma-B factor
VVARRKARAATLFRRLREEGDKTAREQLVHEFVPLARWVARRYGATQGAEDVRQVAYLGLVKAIDRFDPSRGRSFPAFAIPTISGEIKRHLRDYGWDLHVPRDAKELALQAQRANETLTHKYGRAPTVDEVAEHLHTERNAVLEALTTAAARHATSLDGAADAEVESARAYFEPGAPDQGYERVVERDALRSALTILSERERQAIGLRFFAGMTQAQIAAELGVSQMQVSRILSHALSEMRDRIENPPRRALSRLHR